MSTPIQLSRLLLVLATALPSISAIAQTTISTASSFTNNNGTGTVTFNFQNTNGYAIVITNISGVVGTTDAASVCELWYKTTPVNGTPGAISNANGWYLGMTSTFAGVANTTTTTLQQFLSGGTFQVPANTTYGIAICGKTSANGSSQRYHTMTTNLTLSAGGCNMIMGTNVSYGGGVPPAAPGNTPRGWIGSLTFSPASVPSPNDAGVAEILSPLYYCSGDMNALTVRVQNFGSEQLDSCMVVWDVNNSLDSAWYNVALDTVGGTGNTDTVLTLDSISATGALNIAVYTRWPNGIADTTNLNDTSDLSFAGPALEGTYVIGTGSGANYPTFTAAVADLNSRGVCDDVIFNVQSGTYTEQIQIDNYVGASEDATVTFKSLAGSASAVTLQWGAANAAAPHTVKFNGGDWVTFEDLTILNTATSNAICFDYTSNSDYNTLNRCAVICSGTTTSTTYVVRMTAAITTGNTFKNSTLAGGYYAVYCYSGSTTSFGYDLTFENNTISTGYIYGLYIYSYRNTKVTRNTITALSTSTYLYGVYMLYSDMSEISRNYIYSNAGSGAIYGVYISSTYGTTAQPMDISNNCIISGFTGATATTSYYGMYITASGLMNIYNNSITKYSGTATYPILYITGSAIIRLKNNTFTSYVGSNALFVNNNIGVVESDYNNFYTSSGALVSYSGLTYTSLQSYSDATGFDIHSVNVDPDFSVAFECKTCSEDLDGAGAPGISVLDIDSNLRSSTTPDIGATEYVEGSNFSLGPDTAYCGNTLTLESGPAQSVLWLVNSVPSTGQTVTINNTTGAPVDYTVLVNINTMYCGSGSDEVVIRLIPGVSLDSSAHLCADEDITLSPGGGSQATYNWSTGENTASISVSSSGSYSVVKSEEGCESSASIEVTQSTAVQIDDVEGCLEDGAVSIDASIPDGFSYAWSGGSSINTAVNTFDQTGIYTVTATDSFACVSSDEFNVNIIEAPQPAIAYQKYANLCVFSSTGSLFATANSTYAWSFGDGNTSSDANPSHAYLWSGTPTTYTVTLEITNICGTDLTTTQVKLDPVGTSEIFSSAALVYPNPASDLINIEFSGASEFDYELIDLSGRVLRSGKVIGTKGSVSSADIARGSYLLKLATEAGAAFITPVILQ